MDGCRVASLHVYPVKSCRGVDLEAASFRATGIAHDREWMVVDARGRFLTQREFPQLARAATALDAEWLTLSAWGHGSLRLALRPSPAPRRRVAVWGHETDALDCGDEAAQWFSDLVGLPARLVRFAPDRRRDCDPAFAGDSGAHTLFSDAFPVLVLGEASVADLRERMGVADLPVDRFRPNVVLAGLPAYDEDFVRELRAGPLVLRLVKRCTRCNIPGIDQRTGVASGPAPLDALASYRLDQRLGGAVLGVNAVVAAGGGVTLRRGDRLEVEFDLG